MPDRVRVWERRERGIRRLLRDGIAVACACLAVGAEVWDGARSHVNAVRVWWMLRERHRG